MLIVLPPSEGKASPPPGPPLDAATLAFGSLGPQRKRVLADLVRLCRGDQQAALQVLGLGPRQREQVTRNAGLRTAPTAPAIEVYDGVLYQALDAGSLTAGQRRRLESTVAIASALFGLVRPQDRIPAYRLSADADLPGCGSLAALWRPAVTKALNQARDEAGGLLWDLRSAAYVSLGPPPADDRTVTSRVLLQRGNKRTVVSHHNKATKGRIVRSLAQSTGKPRSAEDLAHALDGLGYRCELKAASGKPALLDVIVDEV